MKTDLLTERWKNANWPHWLTVKKVELRHKNGQTKISLVDPDGEFLDCEFVGSGTVWYCLPEFRRANTQLESKLSGIEAKTQYEQ